MKNEKSIELYTNLCNDDTLSVTCEVAHLKNLKII